MEAVRKLKANPKMEGQLCGWCHMGLRLADDAAICTSCQRNHHSHCWDQRGGCASQGCMNAPLPQMAAAAVPQVSPLAAQGLMSCPRCRALIPADSQLCLSCRYITSPDGIYHGPKMNAPGATASLVLGLVGLFICGVIFGPLAISKASSAKAAIRADPTLGGEGLATAGTVLGIIDVVGFVILLFVRLGSLH